MFEYLANNERVTHQALAGEIKRKISSGEIAAGEKLPTLSELSSQTGLASYSVRKAIYSLVNSGVLRTEQGGGVYVNEGSSKVKIAIADAFRFGDSYPQLRHPRTISGIYAKARELGVDVDLLRPDTAFNNPEAVKTLIQSSECDGLIWLYPEEDRISCIKSISKQIPIVLTSHSRTEFNLPAVESDESWNAVRVGRHFLNCNVPKVVQLVEPWVLRTSGIHSGGHITGVNSLKMTLMDAGFSDFELIKISHSEIKYRDVFLKTIENIPEKSGIFLANTDCFKAVMETDFDRLVEHLSKLNVVVATTKADNDSLAPLAEEIYLITCVNPLTEIGEISLQKITNLLKGSNEDTSTIVRTEFGNFSKVGALAEESAVYAV